MKRLALLILMSFGLCVSVSGCPEKKEAEQPDGEMPDAGLEKPVLKEVAEAEPNEKTDQAMEIKEGCVVTATLEAAVGEKKRARDWYRIAPDGRQVVRITASGIAGEDLNLAFLDADKNDLMTVDSGGEGAGEVFPNLTIDREIYMRIYGARGGSGGAYRLTVEMFAPAEGEEEEDNGRYSRANPLNIGDRVRGYLGAKNDEDWYQLSLKELPTGSVLRVDLTGVERVRFGLEVLDSDRRPIMKAKGDEAGDGIVIRNLGLPGTPETVYLVVKSDWVPTPKPKKADRTFNPEAKYSLGVSSEAGGDDLEREPNNRADEAATLLDGQKIRGYLSPPDDVDWYAIEVERPSLLSAELSALDRVDLKIYVVDPEKKDQTKDFELVKIDHAQVNEEEKLTNCALEPGKNYVRVEAAWKKVDDKWVKEAENLDETYSLTLNLRTDEGKEEREPNDKPDRATPIRVGQTLRGTLHPMRDEDYYRLDLSGQAGPRDTTIECTGIPKVDVAIALLGPELDGKGQPKPVAESKKGRGEQNEQIQKELMPGEYLIRVWGRPRSESNTIDQYVLTVTQP
jgi:hypothetical protein